MSASSGREAAEAAAPPKNQDLHGSVPDQSSLALVLIDVISDLDFPGGDELLVQALPMAHAIERLRRRAKQAGIPVVYVNDNYGRWQSDFARLVEHAARPESRGRAMVELLRPEPDDYFVLKPKHSGFYSTTLDTLLDYLGARTLILTGTATNMCVLFTASDAHMRDFFVVVPSDCVAAASAEQSRSAMELMGSVLGVDTTPSHDLDLEALKRRGVTTDDGS